MASKRTSAKLPYDLTGNVFGRWTVVATHDDLVTPNGYAFIAWLCRCACGREKPIREQDLLNAKSRQCRSCARFKHGKSRTREYGAEQCRRYRERKKLAQAVASTSQDRGGSVETFS